MLDFTAQMATAQKQGWRWWRLTALWTRQRLPVRRWRMFSPSLLSSKRRLIGQRTREALAAKRAQGVTLGRPRAVPQRVVDRIRRERKAGRSLAAIADDLNRDAVPTAQGGRQWWQTTVRAVLAEPDLNPFVQSTGQRTRTL
jgi:hypothetical protein